MKKRRKAWWIAGGAFALLTVFALIVLSSPSGFLGELSALLNDKGFERVSGYEGEKGGFGYIIAEFELKPVGGKDSEELMVQIAEQFEAVNEHTGLYSHGNNITERFTVEEYGATFSVYLLQQGFYKSGQGETLPESYLVVVQTDSLPPPTVADWIKGLWP